VFQEESFSERLGESVRNLFLSGNGKDRDVLANVGSEEVEPLVNVFGARSVLGIVGNLQGSAVVLENPAVNSSFGRMDCVPHLLHFFKQPDDRKCVLEGTGHANVLSFGGGECNEGLELGCPQDGDATIPQDVAMARLRCGRIGCRNVLVPVAGEVGVNVEV